jgi:hypothetical protein
LTVIAAQVYFPLLPPNDPKGWGLTGIAAQVYCVSRKPGESGKLLLFPV